MHPIFLALALLPLSGFGSDLKIHEVSGKKGFHSIYIKELLEPKDFSAAIQEKIRILPAKETDYAQEKLIQDPELRRELLKKAGLSEVSAISVSFLGGTRVSKIPVGTLRFIIRDAPQDVSSEKTAPFTVFSLRLQFHGPLYGQGLAFFEKSSTSPWVDGNFSEQTTFKSFGPEQHEREVFEKKLREIIWEAPIGLKPHLKIQEATLDAPSELKVRVGTWGGIPSGSDTFHGVYVFGLFKKGNWLHWIDQGTAGADGYGQVPLRLHFGRIRKDGKLAIYVPGPDGWTCPKVIFFSPDKGIEAVTVECETSSC